jgi:DNA-binding beta-propeller fold protein YncE
MRGVRGKYVRYLWLSAVLGALLCATVPASADAAFSLLSSFGGEGTGMGMFTVPLAGITTDAHGNVYVADEGGNRIEEFTAGGAFIREWSAAGGGVALKEPETVALAESGSDSGDLYVTDAGNRRVVEFTPEGVFIRTWGFGVENGENKFQICTTTSCRAGLPSGSNEGGFETPAGVAVDPTSGDVYVADSFNQDSFSIYKYQPHGDFIGIVGQDELLQGTHGGSFDHPTALATDAAGDLYVVDAGNHRVQKLGPSGEFLRTWGRGVHVGESGASEHFGVCTEASSCQQGEPGEAAGDLGEGRAPASIAVDSTGNVWVPDPGNLRVQEFSAEGAFTMAFGWGVADGEDKLETCTSTCRRGLPGPPAPLFESPLGVAAAPSGCDLYVSDADANELIDEFGCGEEEHLHQPSSEEEPKPSGEEQKPPSTGNTSNNPSTGNTAVVTGGAPNGGGASGHGPNTTASAAAQAEVLATALGLPSAKACYSRRSFKIHIHQPAGYAHIVSAEVFLGGRREHTAKGKRITAQIVLGGLPYGTFTIRIVAHTVTHTTIVGTRTYHTCRAKPLKGDHHRL